VWTVAAAGALGLDRALSARIIGGAPTGVNTLAGRDVAGFLGTRLKALALMLLAPGETWSAGAQVGLFMVLVGALVLGLALRRDPVPRPILALAALTAVAGAVVPFFSGAPGTVPSLLVACPVVAVGVVAVRPGTLSPPARTLGGIAVAFAAAVGLTQYAQGGGVEWGARFLAVGLPAILPVALAVVAGAADRLDRGRAGWLVGGLAASSLILAGLAVWSLRYTHDTTRRFIDQLAVAAERAPGPDLGDGDRRPIVVSTWFAVGRITGVSGPAVRGLTVDSGADLAAVAARLKAAGVDGFVLVSEDRDDLATLARAGSYEVAQRTADSRITVMSAR
jgi:hypothetical protein